MNKPGERQPTRVCHACANWHPSNPSEIWGECSAFTYDESNDPAVMHRDEGHDCAEFVREEAPF